MWDASYFDSTFTNDQGEEEQMIADGTDVFDDRYTRHLYGTDGSDNISNLGWGNSGFGATRPEDGTLTGTDGMTDHLGSFGGHLDDRLGEDTGYEHAAWANTDWGV